MGALELIPAIGPKARQASRIQIDKLVELASDILTHYDFNMAGAYSYEQALLVIRQLGLPMHVIEEQFRRMVFNLDYS